MSVLDGPGEGTWSVFAQKVVEERDQLRNEVESLKAQLGCAQAFHDVAVKERDLARVQLSPAMRERDELFAQVAALKAQLAAAQRAYDRALEQRDEAKAEVESMKARPVESEYQSLDRAWKKLEKQRDEAVEQRDKAKAQLKRTHAAIKLVAAERDAARLEAARPSAWLLSEGNMLVRKFAAIGEMLSKNGCDCECDHALDEYHEEECERCLACRIDAALNGKDEA